MPSWTFHFSKGFINRRIIYLSAMFESFGLLSCFFLWVLYEDAAE
jgi:hypothetical protein